ncbi:MAG TPA: lysophospholipid acyltransferase family protein [Fimbriimonadaceae bacterium]|nr:lysophospholipid acyltransferase family protein [Fimbriimonadaceae bacterium]
MRRALGTAWYWFVRTLVRYGFFKLTGGLTVHAKQLVPLKGPLIVAPVHFSYLDPPLIACSLPRKLTFMAKEELFRHPIFGWLIRSLGAFPVRRGEGDTESIRNAIAILEGGNALLIFPEGTRGEGQNFQPVNRGVAMLAKRTGAAVLPVGIVGTQIKWGKGGKRPKWARCVVRFVEPLTYAEFAAGRSDREAREAFAAELSRRIVDACRKEGLELRIDATGSGSPASGSGETATSEQGRPPVSTPAQP